MPGGLFFYLSLAMAVYVVYAIFDGSAALRFSSPFKKYAVGTLRALALISLILAFLDLKITLDYYGTNYIVMIDNSWSMKDNIAKAVRESSAMLEKLLAAKNTTAQYVSFGARAAVEKINLSSKNIYMRAPRAITGTGATNLETALEFGTALASDDSNNKIILFTDGNQTEGDCGRAIGRLKGAGIAVYPFRFEQTLGYDVILTSVKVPASSVIDRKFEGSVSLELKNCDYLDGSQLRIYRDNLLILNKTVGLIRGFNTFKFEDAVEKVGYARYTAFVENPADKNSHNNTMYAFCDVAGTPRILLVSDGEKGARTASLFELTGYEIVRVEPAELSSSMEELLRYKLIVLNDVPFGDLKLKAVKALKSFVTDFGGGLIMAGGDRSFGNGGYMLTPLEDLAPVTMDIKDKSKVVSCAIIFIVDKSGSMAEMSFDFENDRMLKIDMAKEAVIASIDLLLPKDRAGVMSFDHDYKWVSLPVSAADKADLIEKTAQLVADGGTSMYGALEESFKEVKKEKVTTRHLVALTDGITSPGDFNALVAKFKDAKVTLSCVGLGRDADVPFLSGLAEKGGGRFYFCEEAASLPSVFVQETLKSTRNLIVEETFTPETSALNPLFKSITAEALSRMPQLKGYVASTVKPNASLYLKARNGDPLLATIQCGLGKTAGFMFDLYARWSADFLKWPEFGLLLENTVKYLLRPDFSSNIVWNASREGDTLDLSVKTIDAGGKHINFLQSALVYNDADNNYRTAEVVQTNAGTYSAKIKLEKEGNYFFSLTQAGSGGEAYHGVFGYSYPYSDEYASRDGGGELLTVLARETGGRMIDEKTFYSALSGDPKQVKSKRMAVRNFLIQLAMFLFLFEILLWRVDFSAETFRGVKNRIAAFIAAVMPQKQTAVEHSESVGKLLHIKDGRKKSGGAFNSGASTGVQPSGSADNAGGPSSPSSATTSPTGSGATSISSGPSSGSASAQKEAPGAVKEDDEPGGFTKKLLKIKRPKK
jgi:uncharacterized membrane protein